MSIYLELQEIDNVPDQQKSNVLGILKRITGVQLVDFDLTNPAKLPLLVSQADAAKEVDTLKTLGLKVSIITTTPQVSAEFKNFYTTYLARLNSVLESMDISEVNALAEACLSARKNGNTIFIAGNGGSASTASHMANDLAKHGCDNYDFTFRVISLTDNTPLMTAICNDFGYEKLFTEQLRNLLKAGDVLITISSSGNSPNVLKAVEYANSRGALTFGIVGFGGGKLSGLVNHQVMIPTDKGEYGVMEDASLIVNHIISNFIFQKDHP